MNQETMDLALKMNGDDPRVLRFHELCTTKSSKDEIFELVGLYVELFREILIFSPKQEYNHYIGWGLPSREVCERVLVTWNENKKPNSKLVDLGASTGIFTHMFHEMGIPSDKLVAFDLPVDNMTHKSERSFWKIDTKADYNITPDDIIFISWGTSCHSILEGYINNGGHCIIILGENNDGCTFPANYYSLIDSEAKIEYYDVPAAAMWGPETLSVNIF